MEGGAEKSGPLESVLVEARRRSLIGGAPVEAQMAHAQAFYRVLSIETPGGPVLELGSGGGLPGLAMAVYDARLRLVLVDSALRSAEFLGWAIAELRLSDRVEVLHARAEDAGHDEAYRGCFGAVVARSFAPPAVTAECAAPFLKVGGRLIVAEPPASGSHETVAAGYRAPDPGRWPVEGCRELGLVPETSVSEPFAFVVLRQASPCPARYARRAGIPRKRPLFGRSPRGLRQPG